MAADRDAVSIDGTTVATIDVMTVAVTNRVATVGMTGTTIEGMTDVATNRVRIVAMTDATTVATIVAVMTVPHAPAPRAVDPVAVTIVETEPAVAPGHAGTTVAETTVPRLGAVPSAETKVAPIGSRAGGKHAAI